MIAPFPISSIQGADVLKYYKIVADVIYLDASHEYESVKSDINAYYSLLKSGGTLFGDDYSTYWPGVVNAVNEFIFKNNLTMTLNGVIWKIIKP